HRRLFSCSRPPRELPSFPTRRSSDLQDVKGAGKGFAFALDHGWFFLQQAGWKFRPGRRCRWGRLRGGAKNQGVGAVERGAGRVLDRKSTRLNSSHVSISYAVFCLKKK